MCIVFVKEGTEDENHLICVQESESFGMPRSSANDAPNGASWSFDRAWIVSSDGIKNSR